MSTGIWDENDTRDLHIELLQHQRDECIVIANNLQTAGFKHLSKYYWELARSHAKLLYQYHYERLTLIDRGVA